MDDTELKARFGSVGKEYGYTDVEAEFVAYRDFKVKWSRNYHWISFQVSDYLNGAPAEVIDKLATTIYGKIRGDNAPYPQEVLDWLTDPEFVRTKQPLFLKRYIGLSLDGDGLFKNLHDGYQRLVERDLLNEDPDLFLGWSRPNRSRTVGRSNILMKVVAMSPVLDDPAISDDLLDYCLYSQVAHVAMGFDPTSKSRGVEYDDMLSKYPNRSEMESELRRMGMHI